MSLNAISKHIKYLESAQLVSLEVEGNVHRITVRSAPIRTAMDWLGYHVNLWEESLMALKNKLEDSQ
jgi:hypothetical protein